MSYLCQQLFSQGTRRRKRKTSNGDIPPRSRRKIRMKRCRPKQMMTSPTTAMPVPFRGSLIPPTLLWNLSHTIAARVHTTDCIISSTISTPIIGCFETTSHLLEMALTSLQKATLPTERPSDGGGRNGSRKRGKAGFFRLCLVVTLVNSELERKPDKWG